MSDAQEMPEATLRALRASIEHWVENGKATKSYEPNLSAYGCALCDCFALDNCNGCPVAAATKSPDCKGTPYYAAARAYLGWLVADGSAEDFHEAAHDMENLLRALVPAGSSS